MFALGVVIRGEMGTCRVASHHWIVRVEAFWGAVEGVEISNLQWVGTIRYPESITTAIQARTATEQRTLAASAARTKRYICVNF